MSDIKILNSWKEISNYIGRGVRTVQRWEEFGLPVHRPASRDRSAVYALVDEVDAWLKAGATHQVTRKKAEIDPKLLAKCEELQLKSSVLRAQMKECRENAAAVRAKLHSRRASWTQEHRASAAS